MALFTISDLHLSFSVNKPMNIFGDKWNNYEERLKENWNSIIKEDDTVVLPGDLSWGIDFKEAKADFSFIHSLNGKKIITKGNHDYFWGTVTKMTAFFKENGFDSINILHNNAFYCEGTVICGSRGWSLDGYSDADKKVVAHELIRLRASLECGLKIKNEKKEEGEDCEIIVFSHYPLVTIDCSDSPFLSLLNEYGVKKVYFGHLHNVDSSAFIKNLDGINFNLVSADYLRFVPLLVKR